jgi:antibiotic biosynthesis monooxygenase (ABM) superfamily enzyme
MYGTTMIGKLASGVTADQIRDELTAWEKERNVPGYVSSHIMLADDGRTMVNVAIFDTKENYMALANDPAQDEWYQKHFAPMLDGDPQWIDGAWVT